jgi:hypothetical protein
MAGFHPAQAEILSTTGNQIARRPKTTVFLIMVPPHVRGTTINKEISFTFA